MSSHLACLRHFGREEWDGRILPDPRVAHIWDDDVDSGRWFAEEGFGGAPLLWDALLVYGPDSYWEAGDKPSDLLVWDWPMIAHTSAFGQELRPLLEES